MGLPQYRRRTTEEAGWPTLTSARQCDIRPVAPFFYTTAIPQLLYNQSVTHFFHLDGGVPPLASFTPQRALRRNVGSQRSDVATFRHFGLLYHPSAQAPGNRGFQERAPQLDMRES